MAILLLFCVSEMGLSQNIAAHGLPKPAQAKPDHELYHQWHNICLKGDSKEIDLQIERYEGRLKANDNDQLARVYLGSACALRAKSSFWLTSKLKYLKRGQSMMDEAVTKAPREPRVRMIRAIGSYKVPKRFGRRKIAVTDFEKLLPAASDKHSNLQKNERQVILYYAWKTFKEEGHRDAGRAKSLCHNLDPHSKYGKLTKP